MGKIVIEESNYKAFALTLANLFLLLAAIAIMIMGMIEGKIQFWLPGLGAAVALLIGFVLIVAKSSKNKALLTITMEGVIDNSSIGGVGFISFDDINEFQVINIYNSKAIAVIPKNMDNFLSKLSAVKRRQVKKNINMNFPPVAINVDMAKDMEPEDILSLLQKRLSDYSSLYD